MPHALTLLTHAVCDVADRRFAAAERFRMQLIDALRISPPPAEEVSFQPGDRIEAQFQGRQTWYAGTISRATATGYDVDYDDGDREQNVSVTLIRSQVTDAWAPTRRACAELAVEARDMLAGQLFGLGDALAAAEACWCPRGAGKGCTDLGPGVTGSIHRFVRRQ